MNVDNPPFIDSARTATAVPDVPSPQPLYDSTDSSSLSSYGSGESSNDPDLSPIQQLSDILCAAFDPSHLDRVVVLQAQSSGTIHAKTREVQQLQKHAAVRLEELKKTFSEDLKVAKQLVKDLEKTQRRIASATRKAKIVYPIEYTEALDKVKGSRR